MTCTTDYTVCTTFKGSSGSCRKCCIRFEYNKIICHQISSSCNGLFINNISTKHCLNIPFCLIICVLLNDDFQVITTHTAIFCSCVSICSLNTATVQTVCVKCSCTHEQINQTTHLFMVIGITKDFRTVLLKISTGYFKDFTFFAPVKFKGHGCNTTFRQCSGCRCSRHKVDVCTGKDFVLCSKTTAT